MLPNVLPLEASHGSLDNFERPPILITLDSFLMKKMVQFFHPMGRRMNLHSLAIETTFCSCKIFFWINCKKSQHDGSDLRYDVANATQSDTPVFVNINLHSLFPEFTAIGFGLKISNSNLVYAHEAFIETEQSKGKEAKDTRLSC